MESKDTEYLLQLMYVGRKDDGGIRKIKTVLSRREPIMDPSFQ